MLYYLCADLQQLQVEAQHRWLRPAEICEILRNYRMFQITSEPPNRPPSMVSVYVMISLLINTSSCPYTGRTDLLKKLKMTNPP